MLLLEDIGLVDDELHRDRSADDWAVESFNVAASEQLAALAQILNQSPLEIGKLPSLSSGSASIVPAGDLDATTESTFSVSRATPAYRPFAEAMEKLVTPFAGGKNRRAKFKIYQVDLSEPRPKSIAHFEISAETKTGIIQQTADWHCTWDWPDRAALPLLAEVTAKNYQRVSSGSPLFSDCTDTVFGGTSAFTEQLAPGVDHWLARIESRHGISISGWEGASLGDVNGDGLDDLYICQPGGLPNRLFVQKPDGTVFDASSLSGTDWRLPTQAALFVDLDNSGSQDLVLSTSLGLIFMANDGRGTFSVKASKTIPEAAPLALAAADFDLDGDLDIYAGCYSLRRVEKDEILGRPVPYHDANNGGRNALFRNDQNFRFTDVTRAAGLDENNRRFTLAAAWEDYDNDGDADLYVANDYGRNNLYRNDGGTFSDVAAAAGVEDISAGMSVSWGDPNNDGNMDIYVSNMWSSAGGRVSYQREFRSGSDDRENFQRHARGNSLFLNSGDGTFSDASQTAGVTMGRWAWGSRFVDFDNDGREDIVVANGFITQADPGDL